MPGHSAPWLAGLEKRQERFLVFGSKPCFWLREEKSTNGSHQIGLQQLSQHFGNKSSHYLNNVKTVSADQLLFETFGGWWGEELISSSLSRCPFSAFSSCSMRVSDMLAAHLVICVLCGAEGCWLSFVSFLTWDWPCPGPMNKKIYFNLLSMGEHLHSQNSLRESWVSVKGKVAFSVFRNILHRNNG